MYWLRRALIEALADHITAAEGPDGPYTVFESGAILLYLADKTGRVRAPSGRARYDALQCLMVQLTGQGPTPRARTRVTTRPAPLPREDGIGMLLDHGVEHGVLGSAADVRGSGRGGRPCAPVRLSGPCALHAMRGRGFGDVFEPVTLSIALGLFVGKQIGTALGASWLWYTAGRRPVRRVSRFEELDAADINRIVVAMNRSAILNRRAALASAASAACFALRFAASLAVLS